MVLVELISSNAFCNERASSIGILSTSLKQTFTRLGPNKEPIASSFTSLTEEHSTASSNDVEASLEVLVPLGYQMDL